MMTPRNPLQDLITELCPQGVEFHKLGDVCEIKTGKLNANAKVEGGLYPFFTCDEAPYTIDTYAFDCEAILISGNGSRVGHIHFYKGKFNAYQRTYILNNFSENLFSRFLLFFLKSFLKEHIIANCKKASIPYITLPVLQDLPIPIPPLEIQNRIVEILDTFTELEKELEKELSARKKQYEYYRNTLLSFESLQELSNKLARGTKVEMCSLGEVCEKVFAGGDLPKQYTKNKIPTEEFPYPIYSNGSNENSLYGYSNSYKVDSEAVTISARGTIGFHTIRKAKFTPIVRLITLIPQTSIISSKFLNYALHTTRIEHAGTEVGIPQLTIPMLEKIQIPLPPIEVQNEVVEILDRFDAMVSSITEGLPAEIHARKKQYEYYRDRLLSFEAKA